jgi:hypothetical protein
MTPLQQAITHYNKRTGNAGADFLNGSIVDYLKSLLPAEEKLLSDVWEAGQLRQQ